VAPFAIPWPLNLTTAFEPEKGAAEVSRQGMPVAHIVVNVFAIACATTATALPSRATTGCKDLNFINDFEPCFEPD